MATIKADEITKIIREQIENYEQSVTVDEVGSVISVGELAYMAAVVNGQTYRPLEAYTVVAVLYFALLFPMTQIADYVERRLRVSD